MRRANGPCVGADCAIGALGAGCAMGALGDCAIAAVLISAAIAATEASRIITVDSIVRCGIEPVLIGNPAARTYVPSFRPRMSINRKAIGRRKPTTEGICIKLLIQTEEFPIASVALFARIRWLRHLSAIQINLARFESSRARRCAR